MSKCSKCQNEFIPLLKSDGLPYKHCDRCRCTDKKYRDKHKEQIKEYREANKEHTKEYGIYYRELNKDILKEKANEYIEGNKGDQPGGAAETCFSWTPLAREPHLLTPQDHTRDDMGTSLSL